MNVQALFDAFPDWCIKITPVCLAFMPLKFALLFVARRGKELVIVIADNSLGNPVMQFHETLEAFE